ncbi:hypothetical protein [Guptibacillus spartinae]|uniref:hypothetical protein n=1 Tax=Guptibacillus spartinae TaxID=3025679 RepID=UPI002360C290|nr:hypothetical protein [Pseudalkalibacillus spartinae]
MSKVSKEEIAGFIDDALFADGFDDAIIGYVQRCGMMVVLYDARKCIEILVIDEGMTEEEALDYFSYNVLGAWVGENTPAFAFLEDCLI